MKTNNITQTKKDVEHRSFCFPFFIEYLCFGAPSCWQNEMTGCERSITASALRLFTTHVSFSVSDLGYCRFLHFAEGFPIIYTFTTCREHYALVMELLGPSLADLLQACGGRFSMRTVAMIAQQLVSLLFPVRYLSHITQVLDLFFVFQQTGNTC
jgi:hypothetical protein